MLFNSLFPIIPLSHIRDVCGVSIQKIMKQQWNKPYIAVGIPSEMLTHLTLRA